MALPNVPLPPNTWVDLYAGSGAQAGRSITIQNLGTSHIRLSYSDTQPTDQSSYVNAKPDEFLANKAADGAWAYSPVVSGVISVQES